MYSEEIYEMYKEQFSDRLVQLRTKKGSSARDMSLSIGQHKGYINDIESKKTLPSMSAFFFICDYLQISPSEFFDTNSQNPEKLRGIIEAMKRMNDDQLDCMSKVAKTILK